MAQALPILSSAQLTLLLIKSGSAKNDQACRRSRNIFLNLFGLISDRFQLKMITQKTSKVLSLNLYTIVARIVIEKEE